MSGVRWDRVDALIDASPGLHDLRVHGLHLLAARRWRALGRPVPPDLVEEEVVAAWRTHSAPAVLRDIRDACDGPIVLMKGPAVAARFPDPAARPFIDIDLLVPDPAAVQASLLAAGYRVLGDPSDYPDDLHHLPPIHRPPRGLPLEVHGSLKWVDVLPAPSLEMLLDGADEGALGVEGVHTPAPAQHALVLTGHLWAHDPLTRLLRVLDVAVMADAADPTEIEVLAEAWGMGRMWRATRAVADALVGSGTRWPWPLRSWARPLATAREPTITAVHLSRVMSPFFTYPPGPALRALTAAMAGFVRPHDGETWSRKLRRTARQVARPSMRRSEHLEDISAEPANERRS